MKRILFISHRIPYPPNKGDKIRSFHELQALSKDYEVDLITFVDMKKDIQYRDKLGEYCSNVYIFRLNKLLGLFKALLFFIAGKSLSEGYYFHYKAKRKIKSLIGSNNYAFIFCYSAQVGQYVAKYNQSTRVMDFVDVDSDKWRQYGEQKKFPFNIIYQIESKRLLACEKAIAENFSLSVFSTEGEINIFKDSGAKGNMVVIRNGVDSGYFRPLMVEKEKALVFVGAMDYYPNIDAVSWFVNKVFLSLLREIPDLKFYIVGSNPTIAVKKLTKLNPNIIVTGYVDDVRPYMARALMAVMPIRLARGIQNKILEAMAMELPVVINDKLYQTLNYPHDNHIFVYDNAQHMKNLILLNLNDPTNLSDMGKKLREFVNESYNWHVNLGLMKNKMMSLPSENFNLE